MGLLLGKESKVVKDSEGHEHTLYRLFREINVNGINKVEQGGWVENLANLVPTQTLSGVEECWVADEAELFGDARLEWGAIIKDHARVCDKAIVSGDEWGVATVEGNALVCGEACVAGSACVSGNAVLKDKCVVYHVWITGHAEVSDEARFWGHGGLLCGNAKIKDHADVSCSVVDDNVVIKGDAEIFGVCALDNVVIEDNVKIFGVCFGPAFNVLIKDNARLGKNTQIGSKETDPADICVIVGGDTQWDFDSLYPVFKGTFGVEDTPELHEKLKTCHKDSAYKHMTDEERAKYDKEVTCEGLSIGD